jgi:NADH:ubiquinone oxidoreductase subunit F (NADH-binding)/(2Fe-2S) ferredoxin/NAD-dependent dihydropyrimidine dehydrogenase PreA subunit
MGADQKDPIFFRATITCCSSTKCDELKGRQVYEAFEKLIAEKGLSEEIRVTRSGCLGLCGNGPNVVIYPDNIFYQKVQVSDVSEIVEKHILGGQPVERLFYVKPDTEEKVPMMSEIPFFKGQVLRALRNRGVIDPEKIEEYIARDGYMGLAKALEEMTPNQIIDEVKASGLRGRGGGGFPTGLKWSFCAAQNTDVKYVLCNADEGDPGAFMDRSILESDPHSVLEGMTIAGRAMGATQGYIYVRAEYPLAIKRLQIAIDQSRELGLLGQNILDVEGFNFDIDLYLGAGAFVCGEETALIASIEGMRGMPRPRPPFPAVKGLWSKPTVLNNVESYANIGQIVQNGGKWYASLGTRGSAGTKVFALSGDIKNNGLVEVPMGMSIREVIFDICGGIKNSTSKNKIQYKAVQMGGPSGGCIPEHLLDTPIEYEEIIKTGAIMGSGGMVVMASNSCMVDMARFFLDFTQDESCGKCPPCRVGTKIMLDMLDKIAQGHGEEGDIEALQDLAETIKSASLCGLGQTAPNPVLTTIKYFRNEYEAHIYDKECPSHQCPALLKFSVIEDACTKCGRCFKACPEGAVIWEKKQVARIDQEKCTKCRSCYGACRDMAIE